LAHLDKRDSGYGRKEKHFGTSQSADGCQQELTIAPTTVQNTRGIMVLSDFLGEFPSYSWDVH
jgi:hypothetical protein